MAKNILEIKNLTFSFHTYGGVVKSVRDVSFNVREGEILGIVGESGCGKSVTSQCILKLNPEPPGFFEGGSIKYKGEEIITKTDREMRKIRGVEIGFIFQDPMTSLNPTMTVGKQIEEVFVGRKEMTRAEVRERALEILRLVGINEPERRYKQYPHELSGGMKQRVMIAIALVGKPSIIIADEPTTSLDVTIEAQILDLLKELRDKMNNAQKKMSDQKKNAAPNHKIPKKLRVGDRVKVISMNLNGTVHSLPNAKGDLYVQMGILRSLVNINDLILLEEETSPTSKKYGRTGAGKIKMSKSASVSTEINLIGKTTDEAIALLDKYLDDAYLAHIPSVPIVHGKGTGALRNAVQAHLKRLKYVKSFHLGEYGEGDAGVTIAEFKD